MSKKKMIDSRYSIEYVSEGSNKGKHFLKLSLSTLVLAGLALTTSSLLLYKTLTAEATSSTPYKISAENKENNFVYSMRTEQGINVDALTQKELIQTLFAEKEAINSKLEAFENEKTLKLSTSSELNIRNKELMKELTEIKEQLAIEKENSTVLSREIEIKIIENETLSLLLNESLKETEKKQKQLSMLPATATILETMTLQGQEAPKPSPIMHKAKAAQVEQNIIQETSGVSQVDAIIAALKNAKK